MYERGLWNSLEVWGFLCGMGVMPNSNKIVVRGVNYLQLVKLICCIWRDSFEELTNG